MSKIQIQQFVAKRTTIDYLAVAALVLTLWTTVWHGQLPFSDLQIQEDDRPWLYDLSLAYLAGYIFHLLVVVLPERDQRKKVLGALASPLILFTNNGEDLIHDLEFIGRCPEREITKEHVKKVMRANGPAAMPAVFQRHELMEQIYQELIPYFSVLDLDLVLQLQRARKAGEWTTNHTFTRSENDLQLADMRKEEVVWIVGGSKRANLGILSDSVFGYYQACEATREILRRLKVPSDPVAQRQEFFFLQKLNDGPAPTDYPQRALDEALTDPPTGPSPIRVTGSNPPE